MVNKPEHPLVIGTSGCFLFFHEGHQRLLDYCKELRFHNSYIAIGVNTNEYIYAKHKKKIENVLGSDIPQSYKDNLLIKLDQEHRQEAVRYYCKDIENLIVLVTDDLVARLNDIDEIDTSKDLNWVVGEDYINKYFKEKSSSSIITYISRGEIKSSSQLLEEYGVINDKE